MLHGCASGWREDACLIRTPWLRRPPTCCTATRVRVESAFIRALAQGDFVATEILAVDYTRVAELIER
jgi:hypothetical protein